MITRIILFICIVLSTNVSAYADDYAELVAYRDSLKQQIAAVDSEIARCEKSLKGWKTATIIGSIGAVASGIGIIAQTQQIKENKKDLQELSKITKEANETIDWIEATK